MAVLERQNSAVQQTRVKQRGSRGKPKVLPKGYSGVMGVQRQRQQKDSNQTLGNSPRCWRRAYIDITHTLEHKYTTLSITSSTVSLRDIFDPQILNRYARISFFLFCTISFVPRAQFLEANIYVTKYHKNSLFTILHQNLTNIILGYSFIKVICSLSLSDPLDRGGRALVTWKARR
jgi:hypothetical protein